MISDSIPDCYLGRVRRRAETWCKVNEIVHVDCNVATEFSVEFVIVVSDVAGGSGG